MYRGEKMRDVNAYQRDYYQKNLEDLREKHRGYARKFRQSEKYKEYIQRPDVIEQKRTNFKNYAKRLKEEVLSHYSDGRLECACCGEKHIEFLTINHIYGGGSKQMKELNIRGWSFYKWLKKNNYPSGYNLTYSHL